MSGADRFYMLAEVDLTDCKDKLGGYHFAHMLFRLAQSPKDKALMWAGMTGCANLYWAAEEHEMAQRLLKSRAYRASLRGSDRWDRSKAFEKP